MENRILEGCLGIAIFFMLLMGVYIVMESRMGCRGPHVLNAIDRTKDVISDETAAEAAAKAFFDELGRDSGLDRTIEYEAEITFDEARYEWRVWYLPKGIDRDSLSGLLAMHKGRYVDIRRDYGVVVDYGW